MKILILKVVFKVLKIFKLKNKSDRYQYNLPYYNYDKSISQNFFEW